jgi:hypothetical protein
MVMFRFVFHHSESIEIFHLNYSAFSSTAHIVSELKVISDMKIRQELMKKVPKDLYSITCIGCGLDLAVQVRVSIQIKSY